MNYERPELRDRLAADYVLGSLRGRARRRLERLASSDPAMAEAIERWQMRLNPLIESVKPITPPPRVWEAIQHEAGLVQPVINAPIVHFPKGADPSRRIALWRGLSFAAMAIAASLAIYIAVGPPEPTSLSAVAVLDDVSGHTAFVVTTARNTPVITLTQVFGDKAESGHAYQLWLLPKNGKPRSIGVLPRLQDASFTLSAFDASSLGSAAGIAISLEPSGGSPTGQPTGPIMFHGPIVIRE